MVPTGAKAGTIFMWCWDGEAERTGWSWIGMQVFVFPGCCSLPELHLGSSFLLTLWCHFCSVFLSSISLTWPLGSTFSPVKLFFFAFLWLGATPGWCVCVCLRLNEETHRNRKSFQSFTSIFVSLWTNTPIQTQLDYNCTSWNQYVNLALQVASPTPRQAHSLVNSMKPGDKLSPLARKKRHKKHPFMNIKSFQCLLFQVRKINLKLGEKPDLWCHFFCCLHSPVTRLWRLQ